MLRWTYHQNKNRRTNFCYIKYNSKA